MSGVSIDGARIMKGTGPSCERLEARCLLSGGDAQAAAAPAQVVGRYVFYNDSAFDGRDPSVNDRDAAAIAVNKRALRQGETSSFSNVTSYDKGINGVIIDIAGLPAGAELEPGDFIFGVGAGIWDDVPPSTIDVRRGAGPGDPARVTMVWPAGAIRNAWLRLTMFANAHTGLARADEFYFGNLVGETGLGLTEIMPEDVAATRSASSSRAVDVINPYDHNKDGRVNVFDTLDALRMRGRWLSQLRVAAQWPVATPPDARGRPSRRSSLTSEMLGAE
jgi:hypothetical protein